MKSALTFVLLASFCLLALSWQWPWSPSYPPIQPAPSVNVTEYMGLWYQIAALPFYYEDGTICNTAEYSFNQKGNVQVKFSGVEASGNGAVQTGEMGVEILNQNEGSSEWYVYLGLPIWPLGGDYWILDVSEDYSTSMVASGNDRSSLWIYSREPTIEQDVYENYLKLAQEQYFNVSNLVIDPQNCSSSSN